MRYDAVAGISAGIDLFFTSVSTSQVRNNGRGRIFRDRQAGTEERPDGRKGSA